jgi:hypothetical protein
LISRRSKQSMIWSAGSGLYRLFILPIGPRTPFACSSESSFEHASSLLSKSCSCFCLVQLSVMILSSLCCSHE